MEGETEPQTEPQYQHVPTTNTVVGKKKEKKSKAHISAKEYDEITQLISLRLKQIEDEHPDDFNGVTWKDVMEWFVTATHDREFTDASDDDKKRKLANQVCCNIVMNVVSLISNPSLSVHFRLFVVW